jgi:GTP-binding protein HflX
MTSLLEDQTSDPLNRTAVIVTYPDQFIINEAQGLAKAGGYVVMDIITPRYLSRAKYGLTSGQAERLCELVENLRPDVVIFDEHLRSTQIYNLAELTGREIIDRERLILEIFSRRATTAEAKLQVKLAELTYEMPRAKERVRLAKIGEQPGFFGLGKYEVDVYYRAIKRQISTVKEKLRHASKRRDLYRKQRRRLEFPTISLVGYTGVGKTSLFNRLTDESKEISNNIFTTLTTSTRSLSLNGFKALISDTVGFISRLPTYMVEAFHSTLEEITYANLVLLLVDATQPLESLNLRYQSCVGILTDLNVLPTRVLLLFNKADMIDEEQLNLCISKFDTSRRSSLAVSAKTGQGVDILIKKIRGTLFESIETKISIEPTSVIHLADQIDWLKTQGEVKIEKNEVGGLNISIKTNGWVIERFMNAIDEAKLKSHG